MVERLSEFWRQIQNRNDFFFSIGLLTVPVGKGIELAHFCKKFLSFLEYRSMRFQFQHRSFMPRLIRCAAVDVFVLHFDIVEEGVQLIVIRQGERIILMRMTLTAAQCESQHRRAGCVDTIHHLTISVILLVDTGLVVLDVHTMQAGGDSLIE